MAKETKSSTGKKDRPRGGDELVFLALGGLGEIGMNAYLYGLGPEDARQWLMVDCGITFPESGEEVGVDVIMPDLRFIEERRSDLKGLVLTHAHEDHLGAVIELWPKLRVPIYATPFTAAMLKSKLAEDGGRTKMPIHEIPIDGRFKVGPFDIELVTLAHSIPESSALLMRTPLGTVFHTGDWKLETSPLIGRIASDKRLAAIGEEGVMALICDSTNAVREGTSPSEREVAASITKLITGARRCVAVTTFASNVARVLTVATAAQTAGRRLVVAGRALHRVIDAAMQTGYLPPDFKYLDQQQFSFLDPTEVVLIATGSQGEPRAAMARIAGSEHPDIELGRGDRVIFSSRTIPGNEPAVGRIVNDLARLGCELIMDGGPHLVHVTGHPRRDELRKMYGWIRPKIAVPMHGEARHLTEHARLARECGVKDVKVVYNGEIVRLAPGGAEIVDDAPVGRVYRDGRLIVDEEDGPVRARRKLSFVGIAFVTAVVSRRGDVLAGPDVVIDGVPDTGLRGDPMTDVALVAAEGVLKGMSREKRRDTAMLTEAIRRATRSAIEHEWGKRPIVKVVISVVDTK